MIRPRRWLRRQAIRTALAVLGVPFGILALLQRLIDRPPGPIRRLLVIRLDLLGDVVLSLPAVRALRAAYPEAEIAMLVRPAAADIARRCPAVDRVLTFDPDRLRPSGAPFSPSSWTALFAALRLVRQSRFDLVVGLFGVWASLFAVASGAPLRVGYRREGVPFAYTLAVPGRRYRPVRHEQAYCLRLASVAGGMLLPGRDIVAAPEDRAAADRLLRAAGWDGRPLVVINAGAAAGDAKRWTASGWRELIQWLQGRGAAVALVGASADRPLAEQIGAGLSPMPMLLAGRTTVAELIGVLDRAALVVSGDSGPLHLAAALGVPVVAIHGPSDPRISGPRSERAAVVRLNLPCSPCYDATYPAECPLGHHRCMRDLTSIRVVGAVEPFLPLRSVR
ncbi:MAG: glycosyltransferase family 9 protein [Chloroflexota bacterium]|nr:glycosyltransferase family 9 protein [Dehalococcoidia bacterium]MDW8252900.1 glycosyltransferase family 9 protein [Chloroflexota bacterium]